MAVLLSGLPAICQGDPSGEEWSFFSSADLGYGFMDEDQFFFLELDQGVEYKKRLFIALSIPLHFRTVDSAPRDEGVIREQDWDDLSDKFRIVPTIDYKRNIERWNLALELGEQNGVGIGHGSVVDLYYNSTDMDYYQTGVLLDISHDGSGVTFLLENVVRPEIMVGRIYFAPLAWFLAGQWAKRFEIGFVLGADVLAPQSYVESSRTQLPVIGGDFSFAIVNNEIVNLAPYVDLLAMDGDAGLHLGISSNFGLSSKVSLSLRAEYRYIGPDYYPAIFNPFYEYNRFMYDYDEISERQITLADKLAQRDTTDYSHGGMADLMLNVADGFQFHFRYDNQGEDKPHWLFFKLEITPVDRFSFSGLYASQDIERGTGIFSKDALFGIGSRVFLWKALNIYSEFSRRWRSIGDQMEWANEANFGIGLRFVY